MDPHLRWQIVYVCFCMLLVVMIITLVLMLMKQEDAGMDLCEEGEKVCNDHDHQGDHHGDDHNSDVDVDEKPREDTG